MNEEEEQLLITCLEVFKATEGETKNHISWIKIARALGFSEREIYKIDAVYGGLYGKERS